MGKRKESRKLYRNKIVQAAKIVFEKHGFENTTIEMIAKQADIGIGTVYNYFKSKEELFILAMSDKIVTADVTLIINSIIYYLREKSTFML